MFEDSNKILKSLSAK